MGIIAVTAHRILSEVDLINKQKFLAELGRLLTFMYDEDRQTALAMYERMFDETADEQGLLQLLVSPTRQAVVLARSYDAKERKLQIESRSMDENYMPDPEDVPSFIFQIDKTAQQAAELGVKDITVSEDQFSIFDEALELPVEDEAVEAAEAVEPVEAVEPEAVAEAADTVAVEVSAEEEAEAEELSDVEETANALDAFLADFSIENGELVPSNAEESKAADVEEAPDEAEEASAEATAEAEVEAPVEYRLKTNIFLLVLYIFLAIPIGLAGIAVLLIPTVLCLALAVSFVYAGVNLIGMCFGSFAVIADTMVVFGAGLILAALSLLFVWLFIWFLGGVIFGFIRGICRLGRRLCCKEVAVQ